MQRFSKMSMDAQEKLIGELISYESETEWFEFKRNWFKPDELGEYISALANAAAVEGQKCAYFVWGIDDETHEITGTDFKYDQDLKNEPLKHYLARNLKPSINIRFSELMMNGKRLVLLTIPASESVPTSYAGERYIRIGSSKEKLKKYPEKEAFLFDVLKHGLPTIVNTPAEYQDLTFEQLLIYYAAKGLTLNLETFKENLSLLTEDGRYNIMAQLLSDNSHMPIRVAIFSGTTKGANLYSVREFGFKCLLYSLDEVLRYGDVLNIIQADERDRIVERKEVPLFENDAYREAIINAFLHNRWIDGDEPMFTVYSDRIEILSRGTMAPNQTMEGFFKGHSIPVNRRLSEIFLQLHISEKTGRSVPKITEIYGREAYTFNDDSIVVTIPFKWINVMRDEPGNKLGNKPGNNAGNRDAAQRLTPSQINILGEIRNNPNVTKKQLKEKLGIGKSTVDLGIKALRENGIIERIGSNKTGYWKIIE